jgi:hypothetical protein
MEPPKAVMDSVQKRRGISAIQGYAAATRQIWRETRAANIGIDGHIEFVNPEGIATGDAIAVQVWGGPSCFQYPSEGGWKVSTEDEHLDIWHHFPLPVVLMLHNDDTGDTYWTYAPLRAPQENESNYIDVPRANVLQKTSAAVLFETAFALDLPVLPVGQDLLTQLLTERSDVEGLTLSYFDLFAHGLVNCCRSIYFGLDLTSKVATLYLEALERQPRSGLYTGAAQIEFAFGFVHFLLAQNLAQIEYGDCWHDWIVGDSLPHFVVPLTFRGRALVAFIQQEEARLVASGAMPDERGTHVAQEGDFEMRELTYVDRSPRIALFQEVAVTDVAQARVQTHNQ